MAIVSAIPAIPPVAATRSLHCQSDKGRTDFDEKLNLGAAWSKPVRDASGAPARRRSEYVVEGSYDYAVSSHLTLTPDVQLILDPADNPTADRAWVVGLKATLSL